MRPCLCFWIRGADGCSSSRHTCWSHYMMSWWYNFPPVLACVRGSDVTGPRLEPRCRWLSDRECSCAQCVVCEHRPYVRATRCFCTVNIPICVNVVTRYPVTLVTSATVSLTEGSLSVSTKLWFIILEKNTHKFFSVGAINTWPESSLKGQLGGGELLPSNGKKTDCTQCLYKSLFCSLQLFFLPFFKVI